MVLQNKYWSELSFIMRYSIRNVMLQLLEMSSQNDVAGTKQLIKSYLIAASSLLCYI